MRKSHLYISILSFVITCLSCASPSGSSNFYYDLEHPDKTFTLPAILEEVSGLSMDGDTLYCIQDEKGEIFQYDLSRKEITKVIPFAERGDFEGIAIVGNDMYALTSEGELFEVKEFNKMESTQHLISLDLGKDCDAEGLCYDEKNQQLLIVCKGTSGKPDITKHVYSFAIDNQKMKVVQPLSFSLEDIKNANSWVSVKRFKQYEEEWKGLETYNPSGIAIHPKTGSIYILSSKGSFLLVLNSLGEIDCVYRLNPSLYRQPEGITFDTANNLYISNEGQGGKATIYLFSYNSKP